MVMMAEVKVGGTRSRHFKGITPWRERKLA